MTRVAAIVFLMLAVAAAPVAAHAVNYTSVDPQRTSDGDIVVEAVYLEEPGWVALFADGQPVGHARIDRALTTVTDVRISVTAWPENGTLEIRPRLYADDGDESFDPEEDRQLVLFGTQSATTIVRDETTAHVLAERAGPLELVDDAVPVRSVALPADGTVVVETTAGKRLGSQALPAGIHTNVSVPIDRTELPENGSTAIVIAVVVNGKPVRAGGAPIRSVVELSTEEQTSDTPTAAVTTPSATGSASPSPDSHTDTSQPGFDAIALVAALVVFTFLRRSR